MLISDIIFFMINYINGKLVEVGEKSCIVELNAMGWELICPPRVLNDLRKKINKSVKLWTVLKIKEEEMLLYGFDDKNDIAMFQKLTGVSGIGPKSALSIMDLGSLDDLVKAIEAADTKYVSKAHGVGKKTAQRLIVELRGKLVFDESEKVDDDVLSALKSLGYTRAEYQDLVEMMPKDIDSTEGKIGWLVKKLGR